MGRIIHTITRQSDQGGRHGCWVPDDIYHYPLICLPDNVLQIVAADTEQPLYTEYALQGEHFQINTIEARVSAFHEPGELPHVILLCSGFDPDTSDARWTEVATDFRVRPERYPTEGA